MTDCSHETSLWGRCTDCGLTWEQQKKQAAEKLSRAMVAALADRIEKDTTR